MYTVHPRNLTIGPFLTLLFTLRRRRRMSAGRICSGRLDDSLSETAPANAHEAALRQLIADEDGGNRPPLILGPFLTLILTLHTESRHRSGRVKGRDDGIRRRPSWNEFTG